MASKEYGVDLDALDQLVKELNQVLKDMGGPKDKAKNQTYLADGALGKGFDERDKMHKAHNDMKDFIQQQIVDKIEGLIHDFGDKSKKTKEHYEDAEHDNKFK
ncbi:hypothetical protein GCM10010211_79300 [Streptomyces albospinus]|uniref:Uncharacterized protein n=1 Tax=Streptomyces albospinus TaxID=285515 RepID=A0ABQ2VNI7_9ACTN|nr:hypothetical protein [Streptomyces albospinus]GGV00072.1 hypothetical protein GCM10010211_79300 [Streptomyces albospinus]